MSIPILICLLGPIVGDDRATSGTDELGGTWVVTRMTERGEILPPGSGIEIRFDGDRIVTTKGDGTAAQGRFRVDPSRSPRRLDLHFETATGQVRLVRGLYRRSGRSLTLVLATPGADRPTDFVSTPESKTSLILLDRSEPAR